MLKSQDIVIALKLFAINHNKWTQNQLATWLCISIAEVNAGIKRLLKSGLLTSIYLPEEPVKAAKPMVNKVALQEFLLHGIKYVFPAELGEITRGIPTSYAATIFHPHINQGQDMPPVWPYEEGKLRGQSFLPLYPSVPKSLTLYPDDYFYHLLVCVDAIRSSTSRARERKLAEEILTGYLNAYEFK